MMALLPGALTLFCCFAAVAEALSGEAELLQASATRSTLMDVVCTLQSALDTHHSLIGDSSTAGISHALVEDGHRGDGDKSGGRPELETARSSSEYFWREACSQEVYPSSAYDVESYGHAVAARLACRYPAAGGEARFAEGPGVAAFDWSALLQTVTADLSVILMAALLAAAIHRPSLAALPDPYEETSTKSEAVYMQLPQLMALLVAALPAGDLWSAAQAPLLFAMMGYSVSKLKASSSRWLMVPFIASYVMVIGFLAAQRHESNSESLRWLAAKLVPWEVMSTEPVVGVHLMGLCFAGGVACLLFSRAFFSISSGAGWLGLVLAYAWGLIGGVGVDHNFILSRVFGSEVLVSLPARLQMHSFAAGFVVASWQRPSWWMQACGIGLMIAYAAVLPHFLRPDLLHMMFRGVFLPVQVFLVWAVTPFLSIRRQGDRVVDVLSLSPSGVVLSPLVLSFQVSTLPRLGICILAFCVLQAVEMVVWWLLGFGARSNPVPAAQPASRPKDLRFLGEYKEMAKPPWQRMLLKALQLSLFAGLVAATVWCAYVSVLGHRYGAATISSLWVQVKAQGLEVNVRFPQTFALRDWSQVCIPVHVLHGTVGGIVLPIVGWCSVVVVGISLAATLFGMLLWPVPLREEIPAAEELENSLTAGDEGFLMIFRYCTRGNNPSLVQANVAKAFAALVGSGFRLDRWHIEVVTDHPMGLRQRCEGMPVIETVVPSDYKCPKGGKFKARAMHYAINGSELNPKRSDWIVHLDEETCFDSHTVCAIFQHCLRQNRCTRQRNGQRAPGSPAVFPDMGQGVILYNTNGTAIQYHITALADTCRAADDTGKFRMQASGMNMAFIGMHGSFAVINHAIEAEIGFDLGEVGSITEDSYFACRAHAEFNVGIRWIDAFMYEQSPFSMTDLIKQRARWYHGLFYCSIAGMQPDLKWRSIWGVSIFMTAWSFSFISIAAYCFYLLTCKTNNILAYIFCTYSEFFRLQYAIGFTVNFSPYREGWDRWIILLIMNVTLLLVPIVLLEVGGVLYGMYLVLTKAREFYVVQKEA